jgi:hypothetical protein
MTCRKLGIENSILNKGIEFDWRVSILNKQVEFNWLFAAKKKKKKLDGEAEVRRR